MLCRNIARQHDADFIGEDLFALVVDHAAAVAVAIEAQRHVRLVGKHCVAHGVQHFHIFGVRIVVREGVIELAVERHDFTADRFEHLRRECARSAVAASADHFQMPLELRPLGQVGDVARREIFDEFVTAAGFRFVVAAEHDLLQSLHLVWAEGEGAVDAHFHAGPAVIIV